jgi:hypothetical protein
MHPASNQVFWQFTDLARMCIEARRQPDPAAAVRPGRGTAGQQNRKSRAQNCQRGLATISGLNFLLSAVTNQP